MVDFGLAKMYQHPYSKKHMPYRDGQEHIGTVRYSSINVHLGVEPSRRDDLESLAYVLIYFLRGSLPWQGIREQRRNREDAILRAKQNSAALCEGLPRELQLFLKYTRRLRFDEMPKYAYLRGLLQSLAARQGQLSHMFDWDKRSVSNSAYALHY